MSTSSQIQLLLTGQDSGRGIPENSPEIQVPLPVTCPYCGTAWEGISTWGTYPSKHGQVTRYRCKYCLKTFNPAKVPYWHTKVRELLWRLVQLTLKAQVSLNTLAQVFEVPESTLRQLVTRLKEFFAHSFELAKQVQQELPGAVPPPTSDLRLIFYDEGFLRLLGTTGYLMFTLNAQGTPLTLEIEPHRDAITIQGHLLAAQSQLGGLDLIIADGSVALLTAARTLPQGVIVVQQIHQGEGKRARIIQLSPVSLLGTRRETTIELHTGALLPSTESILRVKENQIKVPTLKDVQVPKSTAVPDTHRLEAPVAPKRFLFPEKRTAPAKNGRQSPSRILSGHEIFVRTGFAPYDLELN